MKPIIYFIFLTLSIGLSFFKCSGLISCQQEQEKVAAGSLPLGTYGYTLVVDGLPRSSQKMILAH